MKLARITPGDFERFRPEVKGGRSLPCPHCGERKSKVVDSRHAANHTRRRRVCACGTRFTTHEVVVSEAPELPYVPNFEI